MQSKHSTNRATPPALDSAPPPRADYAAQDDLELPILLPQFPELRDHRCVPLQKRKRNDREKQDGSASGRPSVGQSVCVDSAALVSRSWFTPTHTGDLKLTGFPLDRFLTMKF